MNYQNNFCYVIAGQHKWSKAVFDLVSAKPGNWHFISEKDKLSLEKVRSLNPRYVFFIHWSHKVPDSILDETECVCFHMTDVPYGRGGSPLQNLIIRGHKNTKISALRMTHEFDAGPVYLKHSLPLEGSAQEIFERAANIIPEMILEIVNKNPKPHEQQGKVEIFKRRKPEESEIPDIDDLEKLYDFIRMLDADDYPKAFLDFREFKIEFSGAKLIEGKILANVKIGKKESSK